MIRYILVIAFLLQQSFSCYSQCGANDQYGCAISGPSVVCVGKKVTYYQGCNYNFNKFSWSDGNGHTGTAGTFTVTFTTPGEYCIELMSACARVGGGRNEEVEECEIHGEQVSYKHIRVYSSPAPPVIAASPSSTLCGPQTVMFTVTNPEQGLEYTWTSAGQTIGTGTSISRLFESSGSIMVTSAVPNESACSASATQSIQVINTDVNLAVESESYHSVLLRAVGTGSLASYYWQTSADGESTLYPATTLFEASSSGRYFLRRRSGICWTQAKSIDVAVSTTPPIPEIGVVQYSGYSLMSLANSRKDFTYQFADYFIVSSAAGTETNKKLEATGNNIYTSGSYIVRGRDRETGTWGAAAGIDVTLRGDENINWIYTKAFDGTSETAPSSETKSYFGEDGKSLQTQAKLHTKTGNLIFTSGELRDKYDRLVGSTLPVPIASSDFMYNASLRLNEKDGNFSIDNDTRGTVGWYYSDNNTLEDHVPVSDYPYSETEFYNDGTGEVKHSAGVGEVFRIGAARKALSGTFPVFHELDDYLLKRKIAIPGIEHQVESLMNEGVQSVVRDENGKYAVSISDRSGHGVMTARAGTEQVGGYVLAVTNSISSSANPVSPNYRKMTYFYILNDQRVSITGSNDFIVEDIVSEQRKAAGQTFAGPDGKWPAGFYRVLLTNDASEITISYTNYFQDISYQFYDDAGRLVSSVSPNGMKEWLKNKDTQTEEQTKSKYTEIDKTTYQYNFKGWLLSMEDPDAGESKYQYRSDGNIRFSQNAQQFKDKHFSYTLYDEIGRPVESGEYVSDKYEYTMLGSQLEFDKQVQYIADDTRDWVKIHYDYPDKDFKSATNLSATYSQEFTAGAVSWSENANMKTWYSYDELGRVTWMAQKPTGLERVFVIKYTYNFIGNVLKAENLSYSLGGALLEQFYHYYEYDADSRLSKVYTSSTADAEKKLRATYTYYLHGPLKRIELGDKLQGIDFVYNIHGWLTQINHPDKSRDPGKDGNDVFGMILNYYENDLANVFGKNEKMQVPDPADFHRLPHQIDDQQPSLAFDPKTAYQENMRESLKQLQAIRQQDETTALALNDPLQEPGIPLLYSEPSTSFPDFDKIDTLAVASIKPALYRALETNVVPDDVEFAALKDIFTSLGGTGWKKKTNWPTTWPTTATSAEFSKWFGVAVVNGDVTSLNLGSNGLIGTIPASIANLSQITTIYLQGNSISGSIPAEIGSLSKLTLLYLYTNKLTGTIPASLGKLKNLESLCLLRNSLTGSIPAELSGMTALQTLRLEENNLSGDLPAFIGNMTTLTTINLYDNAFTGPIPAAWNGLTNLTVLILSNNKLSGDIPVLDKLTKLVTLDLRTNTLTGQIPLWLSQCTDLENLYFGANKFTGTIPPSLSVLRKLKVLTLNTNALSGPLPPSLGELSELVSLYVNQNQLSGELPPSYGLLSKLQTFNATENKLTGNIPESYRNLKALQYFNVMNNQLSGELPDIFDGWTKATEFYIALNKFTGAVPASVGSMTSLTRCYLSNNSFTSVPASLLSLKKAVYLMMEGNKLHDIPDFSVLPQKAVMYLYVRNNYLDAADLESLYTGVNTSGFKALVATPQLADPGMRISVPEGESLNITATGRTANTTFIWEKKSGTTWTDITSKNQSQEPDKFIISNPVADDAGIYRYRVTNAKVTALAITSNPITVQTVDALPVATSSEDVLYNGLITSVQWRTDEAYSAGTGDYYGQYKYAYDDKYQLLEANYADFNKTTGMFESAGNDYRLNGMSYDPNGNILSLKRYDGDGLYKNNLSYKYVPNTNKLDNVDTYVDKFTYNAIGQMTDENKADNTYQSVEYDVTGKVRKVYMDANKTIPNVEYLYDDRGFRLAKISYQEKRTTWYIRDASGTILSIYEQAGVLADPIRPIQWSSLTNIVNTDGKLTVQSGATSGTAWASNRLEANQDGYMEYTVVDKFQPKDIGFYLPGGIGNCVFNFYKSPYAKINVRKNGSFQTGFDYNIGDKIRLEKVGDKLRFLQNGAVRFEMTGVASKTAQLVVILSAPTASVSNLVFKAYAIEKEKPSLTQVEIPIYGSGKLGTYYPAQDGSAAYEITDHLGNVRALVRENVNIYTATMEDNGTADLTNPRVTEMNYFRNIFETEVKDVQMNHTQAMPGREDAPDKAAYLYWVSGTQGTDVQDKSVGPAIALKVNTGDKVNLETWARYEHKEDYTEDVSLMMFSQLLGTSFAYIQGFDAMPISQATETFKGVLPALLGAGVDASQPRAFLNYIVFNTKMEYVTSDRVQVSEAAGFEPDERAVKDMHERLAMNVSITEPGYIYAWVSNGSENTKVWFDDFSVSHTSNFVTQATDYGCWGDEIRTQKTDESIYRYSYQGQYAEKDNETGWNHFELREYDPVMGRWLVSDPFRQYWSPYNVMGNDPINNIDPTGGEGGPARPKQGTPSFKYGDIYGAPLPSVTVNPSSLDIMDFFGQSSMPIPSGTFTGTTSNGQNFFESVPVYTSEVGELKNRAAGTLPGVGIFVNPVDVNNLDLLRHEFGHILQARVWGNKFYYSEVVPASLRSANRANNDRGYNHDYTWTEWTANYFSYKYFNSPSDWDKAHPYSLPSGYSRSGIYPPINIFKFYSTNFPKKP